MDDRQSAADANTSDSEASWEMIDHELPVPVESPVVPALATPAAAPAEVDNAVKTDDQPKATGFDTNLVEWPALSGAEMVVDEDDEQLDTAEEIEEDDNTEESAGETGEETDEINDLSQLVCSVKRLENIKTSATTVAQMATPPRPNRTLTPLHRLINPIDYLIHGPRSAAPILITILIVMVTLLTSVAIIKYTHGEPAAAVVRPKLSPPIEKYAQDMRDIRKKVDERQKAQLAEYTSSGRLHLLPTHIDIPQLAIQHERHALYMEEKYQERQRMEAQLARQEQERLQQEQKELKLRELEAQSLRLQQEQQQQMERMAAYNEERRNARLAAREQQDFHDRLARAMHEKRARPKYDPAYTIEFREQPTEQRDEREGERVHKVREQSHEHREHREHRERRESHEHHEHRDHRDHHEHRDHRDHHEHHEHRDHHNHRDHHERPEHRERHYRIEKKWRKSHHDD